MVNSVSFKTLPRISEEDNCAICQDELKLTQLLTYHKANETWHIFHKQCLNDLITNKPANPRCPLCRAKIVPSQDPGAPVLIAPPQAQAPVSLISLAEARARLVTSSLANLCSRLNSSPDRNVGLLLTGFFVPYYLIMNSYCTGDPIFTHWKFSLIAGVISSGFTIGFGKCLVNFSDYLDNNPHVLPRFR